MLEAIILKLITTLTGYLFSATMDSFKSIEVEGAPSWYGKNLDHDNLYAYGYARGDIESIEVARENCKTAMVYRLNDLNEIVIYDNFRAIKDPKEEALISAYKKDTGLKVFVNKTMQFEKIEHLEKQDKGMLTKERPAQTFAGGMIPKTAIIAYQKERLDKIKNSLTNFRFAQGIDELDREMEGK